MLNLLVVEINKQVIAILEDEEEQVILINYLISQKFPDIDCLFARSGEEFQTLFKDISDLVTLAILDVRTPPPDGVEILGWIKKKYPETKVVMFSSSVLELSECEKLKCDGYYVKKHDPEEMMAMLHQVISQNLASGG